MSRDIIMKRKIQALGTKGENQAIVFVIDYYDMSGVVK